MVVTLLPRLGKVGRGLGAAVGPQWGPGKHPGGGQGAEPPEAGAFLANMRPKTAYKTPFQALYVSKLSYIEYL